MSGPEKGHAEDPQRGACFIPEWGVGVGRHTEKQAWPGRGRSQSWVSSGRIVFEVWLLCLAPGDTVNHWTNLSEAWWGASD